MEDALLELVRRLEERVDTMDSILAQLFGAYVELAAMLESSIAEIVRPLEPDEARRFETALTEHRREMLEMVRDVGHQVADAGAGAAETVEPVAERD